jgi:hypothetical protein
MSYYVNLEDYESLSNQVKQDIAPWVDVNDIIVIDNERWAKIKGKDAAQVLLHTKLISHIKIDYKHTVRVRGIET